MSAANRYQLSDLLYLMARLRDPEGGCPWDLQQDFASIVPHTLEEAYEVADAIEREDFAHLPSELGDLLFATVNVARHLNINPESALRAANSKFSERLQHVEQQAHAQGVALDECSEAQLDALWNLAKQALSKP